MRYNRRPCPGCGGKSDHYAPREPDGAGVDGRSVGSIRVRPEATAEEARLKVLVLKAKAPTQSKGHDWANDLEWQELRALIVSSLEAHPAAFAAVLEALEKADT